MANESSPIANLPATIDWDRLPSGQTPGCLDSDAAHKRLINSFFLASLGLVVASAYFFTATTLSLATIGSALLLPALLCYSIAMFTLLLHKPLDIESKLSLRHHAQFELTVGRDKGYLAIRRQYSEEIVSNEELNILMANDAARCTFEEFIKKNDEESLDILHPTNKEKLLPKAIDYICNKYINLIQKNQMSLEQVLQLHVCKVFGIQEADLKTAYVKAN